MFINKTITNTTARYVSVKPTIDRINGIEQVEQRSEAWFNLRNGCITATNIAAVLNEDKYKYPYDVFIDKCNRGPEFVTNEACAYGTLMEQFGALWHEKRYNTKMNEYGLLIHPDYSFIGASPDGISHTEDFNGEHSNTCGRMLEIKFPYMRIPKDKGRIDGDIIPHYYYLQVQTQLNVTNLPDCDFVQYQIERYEDLESYYSDTENELSYESKKSKLERGVYVIKKTSSNNETVDKVIYPPSLMNNKDTREWLSTIEGIDNKDICTVYPFRFSRIIVVQVPIDKEGFESRVSEINQFWNYVLFFRDEKNSKHLDTVEEYANKVGKEKSKDIFQLIHTIYSNNINTESTNTNTNTFHQYRYPLYQESNKWRDEIEAYKAKYANSKYSTNNKNNNYKRTPVSASDFD